jgi:hypothetical protein
VPLAEDRPPIFEVNPFESPFGTPLATLWRVFGIEVDGNHGAQVARHDRRRVIFGWTEVLRIIRGPSHDRSNDPARRRSRRSFQAAEHSNAATFVHCWIDQVRSGCKTWVGI